jgi:hypothetical protein
MNIFQRITLIVGVLVLWIILAKTPTFPSQQISEYGFSLARWDWQTGLVRGGFWCLTVVAIYFAVGKRK